MLSAAVWFENATKAVQEVNVTVTSMEYGQWYHFIRWAWRQSQRSVKLIFSYKQTSLYSTTIKRRIITQQRLPDSSNRFLLLQLFSLWFQPTSPKSQSSFGRSHWQPRQVPTNWLLLCRIRTLCWPLPLIWNSGVNFAQWQLSILKSWLRHKFC